MKILVDARTLGKRPSGVGMYLYNFLRSLAVYEDMTLELISDVMESKEMQELERMGMRVHQYGKIAEKSVSVYAYFYYVQKVICEVKPDIFWEGNNLTPINIKNPYGKMIVTVHDVFPFTVPEGYSKLYQYYFKYNLNKTIRHMDAILYNSYETKKETERVIPLAKAKDNFVSYIVVEVQPKEQICNDGYFLYIGNLEKRKGTDILLQAYKKYREYGGKQKLILAGKVREREIEELYEKISGMVEGVTYVGYADEEKKDELFAKCGCFLFPSRAEGFGMPVIESLIYKKPIIGSELSIFEEIAEGMVQSFTLSESVEESAERLAKEMLCVRPMDEKRAEECAEKYKEQVLGQALRKYLKQIIG